MESRIGEALQYLNDVPGAKVASVARAFGVPRSRLRYRLEGRQPKAGRPAANLKESRPEEAALCRYIDRLDHMNLAVRPEFVTDAANNILRERSGQADFVIGSKWTTRFLKRLEEVVQEQGIPPEDIWNMDETGFRIGVGKDQLIVTKRKRAHYFGIPENRESATDIEAISAGGACIPPFLILSGQMHMSSCISTNIRPRPRKARNGC
ncbi:Tc5 transposase DNA-binding domain-containing protein [Hirsutella rhossiliensis]|uniref:Tc5 transposase DNA-binding domain-containing protein n=1 Tax=Hirsutella rhossiliensis TaxID=111463 RepID=A0A9P8NAI3_9HYPO|nr:tc5 transposase DNA-binding domain-containing protein [Hirsutella rhossiliensis]KAH0968714.1 tc5 transposase DNA-binding domain-containing protein [Hirsutella rhossiliensis]